jgi:hypothetical protein
MKGMKMNMSEKHKTIGILGGDSRMAYLAELLKEKCTVITYRIRKM